jgi:hypothetical protein
MEFAASLWNILTLDESNMGCLAFMVADPTASKTITCKILAQKVFARGLITFFYFESFYTLWHNSF